MSGKNNVNPDYYKVAGRDRAGEDLIHEPARAETAPPAPRRRQRRPRNFIPGAAPVGESGRRVQPQGKGAGTRSRHTAQRAA